MFQSMLGVLLMLIPVVGISSDNLESPTIPVEAFASLPLIQTARLSPNGQYLAIHVNIDGYSHIRTLEVGSDKGSVSVASTDNKRFKIRWFDWANDDRLLVSVFYPSRILTSAALMESELFTVKRDGGDLKTLFNTNRVSWVPQARDRVIDMLPDDPKHVLMELDVEQPNLRDVYKVNVDNGRRSRVQVGRKDVSFWFTDRQHRIRGFVRDDNGKVTVEVTEPGERKFRTLWAYDALSTDRVSPVGFDSNPNILYVRAYHEGRLALFRVDIAEPELTKVLVHADPDYDVEGQLIYSRKSQRVLGLVNTRDNNAYIIWDEEYARLFNALQAVLPETRNSIVDFDQSENRYVLFASSYTHPGTYYFGDIEKRQISPVGERYPSLKNVRLSGKTKVQYPASDGTTIDGYLTLPVNRSAGEKLPAIIFPHGGPAARTQTSFDYWTEFFASRGYAVLEMDFRGSSVQGFEWMASAFANWDRVTQQDIADGATWLVNGGFADPERVCIVGASFGGYAALMGTVKYADRYRCAISIAGVTDLVALRNRSRHFVNSGMVDAQIGKGTERLREASPLTYADQINRPVLLIHGATDRVVEISHSEAMYKELTGRGKNVRYVELETGDHYLSNHFDRVKTFKEMEEFLRNHL